MGRSLSLEVDQQPGLEVALLEAPIRDCLVVTLLVNVPTTGHGGSSGGGGDPAPVVAGDVAKGDGEEGVGGSRVVVGGMGLSPGLAISVEPNGMLARPALNAGGVAIDPELFGTAPVVPGPCAHPVGTAPAMPPPSNSAVAGGTPGVPATEQPVVAGGGLIPGVASSVAPRGMPTGPTAGLVPVAPMVPFGETNV
jgi:hypothetical protein